MVFFQEQLPAWARNPGRPTEYDLLLETFAARGVAAVDLRPPLRAGRDDGFIYRRHDTHWTARGALVGFNAILEATARPGWRLDPGAALGPPTLVTGGDLARMLGLDADLTEQDQFLLLPGGERENLNTAAFPTFIATGPGSGPTILIVGDSFTHWLFPPLLLQRTGRMAWMHHLRCGLDWSVVEQLRPDEVWWMPTERLLTCESGSRPRGL